MHLICLLEHLHGQEVLVDGTTYLVGPDGRTHVPEPAHAKALLANASGWMLPPEPLMPLGADGKPEHIFIPQRPAPEPEPQIAATDDPAIVAPLPEPEDGLAGDRVVGVDFAGHKVTEADEIRAKHKTDAAPADAALSAPPAPASAKVARNSFKRPVRK